VKALRGAQYARNANRDFELDNFLQLTNGLDNDLKSWATELHRLINSPKRLQYPTEYSSMNIPHDIITQDTCHMARTLSSFIVNWCRAFISKQQ